MKTMLRRKSLRNYGEVEGAGIFRYAQNDVTFRGWEKLKLDRLNRAVGREWNAEDCFVVVECVLVQRGICG